MIRLLPRLRPSVTPQWKPTAKVLPRYRDVAALSSNTPGNQPKNNHTPSSTLNALDQAILELAEVGASHLPHVFQALMQSKVFFVTQSPQHTSVKDALTLPSSDERLHPAIFSSTWSAQRYMAQHNLTEVLDEAATNEIAARDFLHQTRPATVLLNPPVFTLTPEVIDSLLSSETEEEPARHRTRLEPHFASSQYRAAEKSLTPQVSEIIHDVLSNQNVIISAYMMEYQWPEDTGNATTLSSTPPRQVLACLCRMTHVDDFESIETELHKALKPYDDNDMLTLCLNLVPEMDVLGFAVDNLVPLYLDLGNMSDVDFTLYADKLSVGPAPPLSPRDRQALVGQIVELRAMAVYQLVYQVAGYTPCVGTFYKAADGTPTDNRASLQECLHKQWGYLHELPPEMVDYISENVTPIYERQEP